jgi:hypothetical protein
MVRKWSTGPISLSYTTPGAAAAMVTRARSEGKEKGEARDRVRAYAQAGSFVPHQADGRVTAEAARRLTPLAALLALLLGLAIEVHLDTLNQPPGAHTGVRRISRHPRQRDDACTSTLPWY